MALQLAERGETLSVIADTLNVSYLLEGSVQRAGENLRVTARLIRAQDSFPGFWTKSYEVSLTDAIRMQTEIQMAAMFVSGMTVPVMQIMTEYAAM